MGYGFCGIQLSLISLGDLVTIWLRTVPCPKSVTCEWLWSLMQVKREDVDFVFGTWSLHRTCVVVV